MHLSIFVVILWKEKVALIGQYGITDAFSQHVHKCVNQAVHKANV